MFCLDEAKKQRMKKQDSQKKNKSKIKRNIQLFFLQKSVLNRHKKENF